MKDGAWVVREQEQQEEQNKIADLSSDDEEETESQFPFTRKMVLYLQKHNLCIRDMTSKVGSAAKKKESRELCSLFRSWEKEEELGDSTLADGQEVAL